MFSKRHYINWFSLIFIITSIAMLLINISVISKEIYDLVFYISGSFLLIIIIFIVDKYLSPNKINIYIIAFSFILSFISYFAFFPIGFYLIFLLYFFRYNFKNLLVTIFLILTFGLLIKYYMLGDYSWQILYWYFPWYWNILLYLITIYIGWMVVDIQEVYFSTGIIIFFWCLFFYLSNSRTYFDSLVASSFIITLPFFFFSFRKYKIDKFSGRVRPL